MKGNQRNQSIQTIQKEWRHFTYETDNNGIVWLTFDKANASTNTISADVLTELDHVLEFFYSQKPKGLVIQSGKKNGFIAGADVMQFKNIQSEEFAFNFIRQGQETFAKLENAPFPTLAFIQGFCLGGGLELALACRYRIAEDSLKTKIGLPEIKLGIHPGWGGTVRLPKLIGALNALDLILTGKTVSGKKAYKMGIVDYCLPIRQCHRAIETTLLSNKAPHQATQFQRLTNSNFLRPLIAKFLQRKVAEKVNRLHYPAPFAVLEQWQEHGVADTAYVPEAKSICQLMVSDTAKNLVRVFFLQERMKSEAKETKYKPQHIHVVGAGVMGGDIAAWCALKGIRVTLQDENKEAIAKSFSRAFQLFQKQLKEPYLIQAAQDRLVPDPSGLGIEKADLIIEAIIEKLQVKQALFQDIESRAREDAILATNTSTIPLNEIAEVLREPFRLVGIHFFNPVAKLPLVEVVFQENKNDENVQKAIAFVRGIDKLPLPVKSAPGFLVNRVLMPYLFESILLLEEGVPAAAIDRAAVEFGMAMGPIELADTIGLDTCIHAAASLSQYFENKVGVPESVRKSVEQGHLGRKSGRGYYQYKNGKPVKEKLDPNYRLPDDIVDRLILRIVNEGVACLRENIVEDADMLDAGMIFGAGFPPWRGGPMHYVEEQGESLLLQRLNLLVQRYGNRFLADEGWSALNAA